MMTDTSSLLLSIQDDLIINSQLIAAKRHLLFIAINYVPTLKNGAMLASGACFHEDHSSTDSNNANISWNASLGLTHIKTCNFNNSLSVFCVIRYTDNFFRIQASDSELI